MIRIHDAAKRIEPDLVRIRRDLHANPELGFEETRTAALVERELAPLGFKTRVGVGKTGIVADLEGAAPGPLVLLRFDMDALPIQENTGLPFASTRAGVMHACGHDGHVAIGLGVARILAAERSRLTGTLRFVFQPAEETIGGALAMVRDGLHRDRLPDYGLSLHVWNEQPFGVIAATPGPTMAAADKFSIEVRGLGGHGATPHLTRDPVVAAAHVVTALQSAVSRNVAPLESAVVSVTTLKAGEAFNVVPPAVTLAGTIRCFKPEVHETVRRRVREIAEGVALAMGCEAIVSIEGAAKAVVNDEALVERVLRIAARVPGVVKAAKDERTMGSEDFPYLVQGYPSCYFFLGAGFPDRPETRGHHHPKFDWDERALVVGTAVIAEAAAELAGFR